MILQRLADLFDRLKDEEQYHIPPFGYSSQRIGFRIVLRPDGFLKGLQDLRVAQERGKPRARTLIVPGGDKPPGKVNEKAARSKVHLLRNDLPFLLGAKVEGGTGGSTPTVVPTRMEFEAFKARHLEIEEEVGDPDFSLVCRFLEEWDPERVTDHMEWADFGTLQGVFQIEGKEEYIHDRPAIRTWWDANWRAWKEESEPESVQCLVSGVKGPPARIHPAIKGVRGGNTTGGGIVGFDKAAFESYGRKQSHNAPVSEVMAFKYVTALNAVLNGPQRHRHCLTLGNQDAPLTVAFWTEVPSVQEEVLAMIFGAGSHAADHDQIQDEGLRAKIQVFVESLRSGTERADGLDEVEAGTRFFILGMAPNAARIAVKFFLTATLGDLLANLRRHYEAISTVKQYASEPDLPPTWLLLDQTCPRPGGKPDRKRIPPVLAGPLFSAVLTGSPYPSGLFSSVIRRIHADRIVNYPRACIIKGHLQRNLKKEITMGLDPKRPDPAYRMGRLFSALEKTQKDALGENLNATIRDRFFGSASATPGAVFPRLLRTYQHHLSKLEGGRKVVREKLVQEILDPLESFPAHLNITDQGLFALGYYHQTQAFYMRRDDDSAES